MVGILKNSITLHCRLLDDRQVHAENPMQSNIKKLGKTASNPIAIKKVQTSNDVSNCNWNKDSYSGVFKVFKGAKMEYHREKISYRFVGGRNRKESRVKQ